MKTITTPLQITSVSSRADGSLRLSSVTPELSVEERAEFMRLQNIELKALLQPVEYNTEHMSIDTNLDTKSPSERYRSVLYVYWKQNNIDKPFAQFYREVMERRIDEVKSKLN